jgi:mRNA interferase MazF
VARGAALRRAEVWWARFAPPDKTRPVVIVSRTEALQQRQLLTVATVTTRRRGIPSEVALGTAEGVPRASVANCDDLRTIPKRLLLRRMGTLGRAKIAELDDALKFSLGIE